MLARIMSFVMLPVLALAIYFVVNDPRHTKHSNSNKAISEEHSDEAGTAVEPTTPTPVEVTPAHLIYLDGSVLTERADGRDTLISDVGSEDVFAAPTGDWVTVVSGPTAGDGDFAAVPQLRLFNLQSASTIDLGEGFSPKWNHDGTAVAFLKPASNRDCYAEGCEGTTTIQVADTEGVTQTLASSGSWSILGWLGGGLLAADANEPTRTLLLGSSEQSWLDIPASEIWGGSPNGRWLITSNRDGASALEVSSGSVTGTATPINTKGRPLGEGAWTSDSSTLYAVAVDASLTSIRSVMLSISPTNGTVTEIQGSTGAMGQVLIGSDGASVAFAAAGRHGRLEALYCPTTCQTLLKWRQDVTLLSLN